ncbi:MAG: hypothetical protein AAF577_05880 [Pseudomonadota bacterium]
MMSGERRQHGFVRLAATLMLTAGLASALTGAVFAMTALGLLTLGLDQTASTFRYTAAAVSAGFFASFVPWLIGLMLFGLPLAALCQAMGQTGRVTAATFGAVLPGGVMLVLQLTILTSRAEALAVPDILSLPGALPALLSPLWVGTIGAAAAMFLRWRLFPGDGAASTSRRRA